LIVSINFFSHVLNECIFRKQKRNILNKTIEAQEVLRLKVYKSKRKNKLAPKNNGATTQQMQKLIEIGRETLNFIFNRRPNQKENFFLVK